METVQKIREPFFIKELMRDLKGNVISNEINKKDFLHGGNFFIFRRRSFLLKSTRSSLENEQIINYSSVWEGLSGTL